MITLRPAQPQDAAGIRELFQVCHKREFPSALWDWQYSQNPNGPALSDVAACDGRVVGHLASLPVRLERGTQTLDAAMWMDLMVHPQYRNLNTFLDLAQAHREHCAQAGKKILFAFPNDRSYPLLKRMLDWRPIEEIDAWEAPLARLPVPHEPTRQAEPCARFTAEFDALWEEVRSTQAWSVRRDSRRLAWRYQSKPTATYQLWAGRDDSGKLRGWLAAKTFAGPAGIIGDILDLWTADSQTESALWSQTLHWFKERGVGTVSAWALKDSRLAASFAARGFAPVGPRTHFAGRWSTDSTDPFPALGRDWDVAKGDSDVF
jgi:hypothetical protein